MFKRVLALLALLVASGFAASGAEEPSVLAEVNGVPITSADLERMIVSQHRGGSMSMSAAEGLVPRLLEKAIRDELILQDAFAMGMGEDPDLTEPIRHKAIRRAVSMFAREEMDVRPVTEEQVEHFFLAYYHRIQIRPVSLGTPEECVDALQRIDAGEVTMGELAAKESLDSKKFRGGLHNDIHWADVDTLLRNASRDLQAGEYSGPFQYGDFWSFIRVESRTPPDRSELPTYENFIRGVLTAQGEKRAWDEWVSELRTGVEFQTDDALLAEIREDESELYRGEFKHGSEAPLIWIDEDHALTDEGFRRAMSTTAMSMGGSSFEEILTVALGEQSEYLALWLAADQGGWLERPEVIEYYESELEQVVLDTYLDENIGQKIRFNREEYEQFYLDHQEDFRGDDQVRLSIMTTTDEAAIREAAERLGEGADFEYVRADVEGREPSTALTPNWAPITSFNEKIIEAVSRLEVGGTSAPVPYGSGWMILRLDGRREGPVRPMAEVDGSIRQALYYREFSELLDRHLERLAEASDIVRYEDRIRAWAEAES
jgi:parvulin-like peptidyl-prolyl isomerase